MPNFRRFFALGPRMPYLGHMTISEQGGPLVPQWTFEDRLRKARELTGMTQAEFAKHIGVGRNTVVSAEKGGTVRRITLNAWALASGVSAEWLLTGETPTAGPSPDGGLPATPKAERLAQLAASKRARHAEGTDTRRYDQAA